MGFDSHAESFAGWPVAVFGAEASQRDPKKRFIPRIYAEYEDPRTIAELLNQFVARPDAATVPGLVFGKWLAWVAHTPPDEVFAALIAVRDRLPALRHLFVGDIIYHECMTSWLSQGDYGPLLAAFPRLETLRVRGSQGLAFGDPFRHASLRSLIVEDGGLQEAVYDAVAGADLPNLEHLELWLGIGAYGGISDMRPVQRLLASLSRFPKLRYLGLRNAELADDVARELAASLVIDRLRILDLSMGTLTDIGAEALLACPAVRRLERLDVHHHYLSPEMEQRLLGLGIPVDAARPAERFRHRRYNAVSE